MAQIYDSTAAYPRDLAGYGTTAPHAQWPGCARIAVQFVLNFEEGGENHILHVMRALRLFSPRCSTQPAFPRGI